MSADLDRLAREAAGAARRSVASVAAAAAAGDPPSWRAMAGRRMALAAAMVVVLAGAAAVVLSGSDGSTRITSGPAAPTETALPPFPPTTLPAASSDSRLPSPAGQVLGTGRASNGLRWTLHIGGPSNELCLSFGNERTTGGACAGRPFGEPLPGDEQYRPLRMGDARMPLHVFGRVPPSIVEVEVELAAGGVTRREPVLRSDQAGDGDRFYVVEVDREPVAVVGIRADGSKVRYELSA